MTARQLLDKWIEEFIKGNDRFPTVAELMAKAKELGVEKF